MEQQRPDLMLQFCKAMADESRLRMIGLLAAAEHSVQDLAALLALKEPTVSHHLAVLKQLDMVKMRADGNFRRYRLDHEVLRKIGRTVFSRDHIARLARPVAPSESEAWERKVLATFIRDERLIEIPVAAKKRWVILKWLAGFFEAGVNYSEARVNALIKRYHADCATLRRELVGYRMLTRNAGIYRRRPQSEWRIVAR
jgi:hypothetical protein